MVDINVCGKGLNNMMDPYVFGLNFLAEANNVDINNDRTKLRRRSGYALKLAGVFSDFEGFGDYGLAVKDNGLYRIDVLSGGALQAALLRSGLSSGSMAYHRLNDNIYYSNRMETGVVVGGKTHRNWGITPPSSPAALTSTHGTLRAGTYLVAVTYVRNDGQESGSSGFAKINLSGSARGISITGIPVSSDSDVTHKRIYLSGADGEELHFWIEILNSVTSLVYDQSAITPVILKTQANVEAPVGQIIRDYNGRMFVAQGNLLWYSEVYGYELFDKRYPTTFDAEIVALEPVMDGIFVSTREETIFMAGLGPEEFRRVKVADYSVIPYMTINSTDQRVGATEIQGESLLFVSERGLCLGGNSGLFINLTEDYHRFPKAVTGNGILREFRGISQIIFTLKDAGASIAGSYEDFPAVDEIREHY